MTDGEIEKLYRTINNFDEFIVKMDSMTDFEIANKIKVVFEGSMVRIEFPDLTAHVPLADFRNIVQDLQSQRLSDLKFMEIRKNRPDERSLHVREDNTFVITEEYLLNLGYSSDISSGYGWYLGQIKEILRLLEANYKMHYKNEVITTREQFIKFFFTDRSKFDAVAEDIASGRYYRWESWDNTK